jgi:DNA-binding NarL/FixJ family response regulator
VRVILADDAVVIRQGVGRLLQEAGVDVVAQVGDAPALLREVALKQPDVAVVDIRMPPTYTDEGLRAAQQIRSTHPRVAVLVLSQHVDVAYATNLLSGGERHLGSWSKTGCSRSRPSPMPSSASRPARPSSTRGS